MNSRITAGAPAGIAGGIVFGMMMQMMSAPTPDGGSMPIAAQLGDRPTAERLLREAFASGVHHGMWLHTDPDLAQLRVADVGGKR